MYEELKMQIHKTQLSYYESMIKFCHRQILWDKGFIALYLFNEIFLCYNSIKASSFSVSIFYLITFILWIILLSVNIKNLKEHKEKLKKSIVLYNTELKIVDFPKYLKNQRMLKLKKLNKLNRLKIFNTF